MKSDEKTLIDGLFSRLREAEGQSAPRDAEAEAQINQHLVRQPAAPYYMAQVVLIQEAALKRLDQRVKELEAQVAQLQQRRRRRHRVGNTGARREGAAHLRRLHQDGDGARRGLTPLTSR
ncbi:DUF2076 domain-containing protein, partial [Pseudomonas aeruginosa]